MKKIFSFLIAAILGAFCLTACNDRYKGDDYKVALEVYIINNSGEYEYIHSKSDDYLLNRLYALSLGEDYLLYIGTYCDGKFGGVAYENISFKFDEKQINITQYDGCKGSYYVLSGVSDCIKSKIEIHIWGSAPYAFNYIYNLNVSFHAH